MEKHYNDSNKNHKNGKRIPYHDLTLDPKSYNLDCNGKPIINIIKKKQSTLSFIKNPPSQFTITSLTKTGRKRTLHEMKENENDDESQQNISKISKNNQQLTLSQFKRHIEDQQKITLKDIHGQLSNEPQILKEAESRYKLESMRDCEILFKLHNDSYPDYEISDDAVNQLLTIKNILFKITLRGILGCSFLAFKQQIKQKEKARWEYQWEFIRLLFQYFYKKYNISDILFLWEKCVVMDCVEPLAEGSMNKLAMALVRRGSLSDAHLITEFLIRALWTEFGDVDDEQLIDELVNLWFAAGHPSPITKSSKYTYSPTVDKILLNKIKHNTLSNDLII